MVNLATGAFAGPNYVNSNQDLDPETSNSVDLGMRYFEDSLTAELSFFSTWADDYIDHILCTGTGLTCLGISDDRDRVYDNIDQAQTFGAEFSGEVTVEQFTPYVNLAWLRRRFENAGAASYDTGLPALSGRGGVRVQHAFDATSEGWADVYFRAASDADELGRRGTEHHPGWATLNLSLGLTLGKRAQYRVVADLLNLTDKEYTPATENLLARGRSAIVRVAIDL